MNNIKLTYIQELKLDKSKLVSLDKNFKLLSVKNHLMGIV
jgi:hypothetical protein